MGQAEGGAALRFYQRPCRMQIIHDKVKQVLTHVMIIGFVLKLNIDKPRMVLFGRPDAGRVVIQ